MNRDLLYLDHIKDSIKRILDYTSKGKDAFLTDTIAQDAVLRVLQVLSESCKRLSEEFVKKHSNIPWKDIIGIRNVLVHDYLGVDLERIWEIVTIDIPNLKSLLP
jgi:uncharacterized protein with HEPN domain